LYLVFSPVEFLLIYVGYQERIQLSKVTITSLASVAGLLLIVVVLLLIFFDLSSYSEEEIEWCKEYRPLLPIDICAREFGY
jgi:hypothetical protein